VKPGPRMHGRVLCLACIRIYHLANSRASVHTTGSAAEVIAYSAICTHGSSLIPDPPLHVRVQGSGFSRKSSNSKCFLLPISICDLNNSSQQPLRSHV